MASPLPVAVVWRLAFTGEHGPKRLVTRAVLLYLSTQMRADGSKCFPSYATIGSALKMHPRTVQTHVKLAASSGWLRIAQRPGGRGGRFNVYLPAIPAEVAVRLQDELRESSTIAQPIGGRPTGSAPEGHRVGPGYHRVGGGFQRVGGRPSDLVVLGSYQSGGEENGNGNSGAATDDEVSVTVDSVRRAMEALSTAEASA